MNNSKCFLIFLFPIFFFCSMNAQTSVADFELSGSATKLNDLCIRLVPDYQYESGAAWYKKAIDLNMPFEMQICLVLGCEDEEGADGIVFVFYPHINRNGSGFWGEGMGFAGLRPSLGIEFDTYRNYHLGDPAEDHLAIMANGETHHAQTLVGPIVLPNLENCERHPMRILWNPDDQKLQVYLDDELRAVYDGDLVNTIFRGNSAVYWGVTAATGRLSNNHDICIKKLQFAEAKIPSALDKELEVPAAVKKTKEHK